MKKTRARRPKGGAVTILNQQEVAAASSVGPAVEYWARSFGRSFPWRGWTDPYRLAVVEILLQRTRADVVADYVDGFFRAYPGWSELAAAGRSNLEDLLRPLGLYRRRAEVLLALSRSMADDHALGPHLPGFGQYVDRAVRVALAGDAVAMVDSNFVRILVRLFDGPWTSDYRYDRRLQALAQALIDGAADPRMVNWAMLDFGALVCRPRNPECPICPIAPQCQYFARTVGRQESTAIAHARESHQPERLSGAEQSGHVRPAGAK